MNLEDLSNEHLLSGLDALVGQGRTVLARLLAYLGEVEQRRLDLESACSSLFDFCVRRLGMGDDEACRRVAGARLVRRFPVALAMIERGDLHLTGLLLLRPHLTDGNHQELLQAASAKTKSEIQHLLAERFPRPDAPSRILALPEADVDRSSSGPETVPATSAGHRLAPSRVEPLAPERYKITFTAGAELKGKIERAVNLMRHANPSGDLSIVVDRALDLLLAKLEKERLGKAKHRSNRAVGEGTRTGRVPRAVRCEVFERDGERCTFVDGRGRRCPSRAFLELDHRNPRALGGPDDADNLSVKCRAHNLLAAEHDFGRAHIERKKNESKVRQSKSQESCVHQRQSGCEEVALRALCGMGFKERDARRALGVLEQRRAHSRPPPLETLLREALSVLA